MKIQLIAGLALLASAGTAFAEEQTAVVVNASASAQCGVSGGNSAVLAGDLSDSDGRVNGAASQNDLVAQLNATNTVAWCSGTTGNKVVLTRTALVRNGSTGTPDANGFLTAVLYDVGIDINDANAVNNGYTYDEGTSDGAGSGPSFGPFGATGLGATVLFVNDTYAANGSLNSQFKGVDLTGKPTTDDGATNTFTQSTNRLQAGNYTGTLTLTLTPGT